VLFCDLVNSTELAARLDPEDWQEVLRRYHASAGEMVTRYGGHVAQYLGDGLLVYFGWPRAWDDAAERAVRAGLDLVDAAAGISADGAPLGVRVGLHTGPVVVGALGAAERQETLALGEVPNVAARVLGVAEPGMVLVSAATQRLVAGLFVVEDRGARALKGVPEPVTLYRVVQPSGVRSRLDASLGRFTPFVGRQTELGVLADAWEHVVEGRGQTLLVSGEAGLGKSRLCYELRTHLGAEPHTWLECRCSPYTEATAFRPVIELVEQALAFEPRDTPAERLGKLATGLARSAFPADETVPLLAEWLGLPEQAGYAPLAIDPDLARHRTLETLAAWTLRLSELQPLAVLVEDLHWCDPSSLELLGRLVAQSATARVLLVGTARPEFAIPWPSRSNLRTLTLERLTKRQAREMIAAVSRARTLPEAVVEQLVARADGVPLYAEELTQAVMETGGEVSAAAIPVTLEDSLLARLDRLSSAREVAQRASVLGREFPYRLLAAVAGLDEAALRQGLARLAGAELLFVRGEPPEATYTYKHALVQEAAYASLLKRTRRELHGRVVDVLAGEAAAEPEVVARHAEAAGRIDEAVAYYQRAGERARARSAHEEAIRSLRQAIALLATQSAGGERDAREVTLQLSLGGSLSCARGYSHPEVEAPYERVVVLCDALGDAHGLGLARVGLISFYFTRGELERGWALAGTVLAAAQQSGDRELELLGHARLGNVELFQGKFASSLAHLDAARSLFEPEKYDTTLDSAFSLPRPVAIGLYAAWNLWFLGRPDRALACVREATSQAGQLGHPFSIANGLAYQAVIHWLRREAAGQLERAAEAIALSEAQGFPLWLGVSKTFHAAARAAGGEAGALADLRAGLSIAAGTGSQIGAPGFFALLGEVYTGARQLAEARGAVEGGLAIAARTGQHFMDAELHRLRGEIELAAGGAPADAEARFQRALEISREQEARSLELRAATSLARLWDGQGRGVEARDLLAPVYGWFKEGFDTADLAEARSLLERLDSAPGA
jgi:class 3 adenylate cyclase/predicted ATPase